ncbi:hypothetical protein BDZ89DRAFT_102669 [Hymenopellis radicata]|nr:hypothetical protein BDZ89DRAFT_102669 [Hymenopellis radicata]
MQTQRVLNFRAVSVPKCALTAPRSLTVTLIPTPIYFIRRSRPFTDTTPAMSETVTLRRSKRKVEARNVRTVDYDSDSEEERPAKRPRTKSSPKASSSSARKSKGLKLQKVDMLQEMPVELILEILSHLGSEDLVNLLSLCRAFRNVLVNNKDIWRSARAQEAFPIPPPPTDDFGELRWALFLFGKTCHVCGATFKSRLTRIFTLRRRACRNCMTRNMVRGADRPHIFKSKLPFASPTLLELIPPSDKTLTGILALEQNYWADQPISISTEYYWVPDISAMSRRLARDFPEVFHSEVKAEDDPAYMAFHVERKDRIQTVIKVISISTPPHNAHTRSLARLPVLFMGEGNESIHEGTK